jgi:xylose dehydrogenase (NAD/NADP)
MPNQATHTVRWGVLSTANIGRRVIPAIQQSRNGYVVAVASRDIARARAFAAELDVPRAIGSYDALLDDPEIDAVYISLPNSLHRPWTIRAAERGKHVLCEKPLALTASECDDMIAACNAAGVKFMEAFMYRFHPQIQKVQELVAAGSIGAVRLIRAAFSFTITKPGDIRLDKDLGGGALMDVGCYCVNVARLVAGAEPVEVQATAHFGVENDVDETLAGLLRFPGGELALFDCSFHTAFRQSCEIVGTDGVIEVPAPYLPGTADATIHVRRHDQVETMTVPGTNHYTRMAEHFADCVLTGAELRWPATDGRANMAVIDALHRAARTGKLVALA